MQLTPHFHISEFVRAGVGIKPDILENLRKLAQELEKVREKLGGKAIYITSGYRDPEHNKRVGGAKNSYHTKGMAADIVVKGIDARKVQSMLSDWPGGMGLYAGFTHLDIRNYKARWS